MYIATKTACIKATSKIALLEFFNVQKICFNLMAITKGYNIACFSGHFFFCIFEIKRFCFVVAMSDLVHDMEVIHGLC